MIEAMIFDIGGVLVKNDKVAAREELRKTLNLSEDRLNEAFLKYMSSLSLGKITEEDFFSSLSKEYGARYISPKENLLYRIYSKNLIKNDEIFDYLIQLRKENIKLVILSNTIEPHIRVMKEVGLFDLFDEVFLSFELGYRKPDPAIYQLVLDSLKVDPIKVGFTDDKIRNVQGAQALGMQAVVFNDVNHLRKTIEEWIKK